jgi:spore coat protein U-like protein
MPVRIEIVGSCLVNASDLDFGTYGAVTGTPTRGQSSIALQCTPELGVEVSLDAGTTAGATTSARQLNSRSGADRLDYGLYQDAGRTLNWGDTSGVDTLEVLTTGATQLVPVYGEIRSGQRTSAGLYGDVITVRVQFLNAPIHWTKVSWPGAAPVSRFHPICWR